MKISGIYRIVNKINGKQYIGSAVNIDKRWRDHHWHLRNNKHHSPHLQRAWNKHGEESFVFELLWKCDIEDLIYEEQLALNNIKCEYNVCIAVGSRLGMKHSEESKAKMRTARKGKGKGRIVSNEIKEKLSAAHKGKVLSEEHKLKISAAHQGRKHSDEAKANMSAAQKIKGATAITTETRAKMAAARKIKLKATRDDGLIIYFGSFKDAMASKYFRKQIIESIQNKIHYKGFNWEYV